MAEAVADRLVAELQRVAAERGPNVGRREFLAVAGVSPLLIHRHFGRWSALRVAAGLPPRAKPRPRISDEQLLGELHLVTCALDRGNTGPDKGSADARLVDAETLGSTLDKEPPSFFNHSRDNLVG